MTDAPKFKAAYDTLRQIANQMRNQSEPDIDALIPMVDEALASYKICKERLEHVKKLLDERFGGESADTKNAASNDKPNPFDDDEVF